MKKTIQNWIRQDESEILSFLSTLISCHNIDDIEDTRKPFEQIKNFLDAEKISFQEITHTEKMPNLLTSIKGAHDGRHLMLNGHLDVLPIGDTKAWTEPPFSGTLRDGNIFGRGVADMKAGVVAMLYAYRYANRLKDSFGGKLSLALVSDEETGWGRGTGYLFYKVPEQMACDGVLLAEPTQREGICISSKGYTQFEITVKSDGAITGYDNLVSNPIMVAMDIIGDIKQLEDIELPLPDGLQELFPDMDSVEWYEARFGKGMHNQLAKVSFDVSEFRAGDGAAMIPSEAVFTVMMVSPVGMNRQNMLARVRRIVKKYNNATMSVLGGDDGDYCSPENELFSDLKTTIEDVHGINVKPVAEIAISDARYWRYNQIPAYWYGLNGETVGMPNESVPIKDLLSLIEIYTLTIIKYLNK